MGMPSRRTNNFLESGLGHVTPTIFGSTVGYPSDSLASCLRIMDRFTSDQEQSDHSGPLYTQAYRVIHFTSKNAFCSYLFACVSQTFRSLNIGTW